MEKSLTKGQPVQSSNTLGHDMSLHRGQEWVDCGCGGGLLTKGHPAQSSTKLGHEMSTGAGH